MKEYIITSKRKSYLEFVSIAKYFDLFIALSRRNIKLNYQRKWIGITWSLIQPLLVTGLFYIILESRFESELGHYFIYIFSGLMLWDLFGGSLALSSQCFIENAAMVKKIYYPRLLLPLSFISPKLVDFGISYVILVVVSIYLSSINYWGTFIAFTCLGLICTLLISAGVVLIVSTTMVRARNLQSALPFMTHVLFFSSSVMYDPATLVRNEWLNMLFKLNPLTGAIYIFRLGVMNIEPDWFWIASYVMLSLLILGIGVVCYQVQNKLLIDYL